MDIKIGKSFQLFGTTYQVRQPNKVIVKGESVLGYCDTDDGIIEIRRNLKKELKEVVYLHEVTHAILGSLEYHKLNNDELFIERFSKALHQILKTTE